MILYFVYLYFYDRDTNRSKKLFGIEKKKKEAFLSSYFQIISFISLVETVIFLVNASWIITDIRNDEPNEWQFHIGGESRKLAAKVCRFENRQWHANVRILKFILEANRNSLAKETARESSTVPGSQLSNCGTIKTYTWHNQGNGKGRHPLSRNLRIL